MPKLNQVIAIMQGKKTRAERFLTQAHHGWAKDRISGINRSYKPIDEDGERLPPEHRNVQLLVDTMLDKVSGELAEYYDAVATQEGGNTHAQASVNVNGSVILNSVPVTVLLFLERQLANLHTFVGNIPELPSDRKWNWDEGKNCYVADSEQTVKTQKVPTPIVKYEATKEHPAQTELINIDKTVGHWETTHMSGALPASDKADMLSRVEQLQDAVKKSREEANSTDVDGQSIGKSVLDFVFGKEHTRQGVKA